MNSIPSAIQREGFQALFFGHPDATYVFDTAGTFIQCNERLVELTGYSRDELHEMTFEPIVHPDDLDMVAIEFFGAVGGENRRYQSRGVTKSGETFVIDVTNIPVRDDQGEVVAVIGIARDISDIHNAEQARLRMEGQLHSTLDQMAIGIGFVNRQWRFTFINAKGRQYLRHDWETQSSASLWEIFPGLENTDFGATYRRAMEHGVVATTRTFSEVFERWFEVTAFPTAEGIAIHILDVTDDQNTKLQLEENERRLRSQAALLDASQEAMYLRDLDGRITYWNKGAELLFGWSREEALGTRGEELLPVDAAPFRLGTDRVMSVGDWDDEVEMRAKDGRIILVDCRWQLVTDEAGNPSSIFAVDSDITDWKRGEEKRNRAQRLESLGTLAGGIAHDLNNVLTPILMSAQLLSMNEKDPSRLALLSSIETGVKRGADMVRQVLSFARGEEGQRTVLEVGTLLEDLQEMRRTLPKSVRVEVSAQTDLWPVVGDPTQLYQVLVNLVTNACDSMPIGGDLTIRARNLANDSSREVILEIEDTGTGMDADTASKIFEPFFTTKGAGHGTGLGLSTSMTIIRNHGGDLDVYSERGRGSQFRIRLPAFEGEIVRDESRAPDALPRGRNERILVVDDEATIREIACQALEAGGYQTISAENGLEAVRIMERGEHIDLVFTDMMMPDMDGAETAAYFLAHHPQVAVIAASGLNANGGVARAAHSGVTQFLSKPFTTTELLTSVREALDTWGKK